MLHVSTRKRIAFAAIILFLIAAGAFTFVLTRDYAPENLRKRAEASLRNLTGLTIELAGASVSTDGYVTFAKAAVISQGTKLLTCGSIRVKGLPVIGGGWQPGEIQLTEVGITLDFSRPSGWRVPVAALSTLVDRASGVKISAPPELHVDVLYGDSGPYRFTAPSARFIDKRALELASQAGNAPKAPTFIVTADQASFAAPLGSPEDLFAQAIAAKAGKPLFPAAGNSTEGALTAVWDSDGETITFTNPKGWVLGVDALPFKVAGIDGGTLEVSVREFAVKNGAVCDVEGSVFYAVPVVESRTLSNWLSAAGIQSLSGPGVPARFENARVAANFSVKNGDLTVRPIADKPALIWCDVSGKPIPLATGEGHTSAAAFIGAVTLPASAK